MANTINESLKNLFGKMEEFITSKTVIGEPLAMGELTVIPLIDVTVGMGTGISSISVEKSKDSGGGGFAAKMTPSAIVVIKGDSVQLVSVKNQESMNKLIDLVPGILTKLGLDSWFIKKDGAGEELSRDSGV
jgi:uncharacterized spore protein YtfJ